MSDYPMLISNKLHSFRNFMMQVHKSESAVIGIYTYDIARSKVQKATRMAREEGFPLRLTVTPEEE